MNIAVIVNRIGPYHEARLNACASLINVFGIEVYGQERTYIWEQTKHKRAFKTYTLFKDDLSVKKSNQFCCTLFSILDEISPDVIALPGWSFKESIAGLQWALANQVPTVLMSDSQKKDKKRFPLTEYVKKKIVRLCHTGFVAGASHQEYINYLGLHNDNIFTGYDVVDNGYFAEGADAARADRERNQEKFDLPGQYFLSSNRFIAKKNLFRLIRAYGRYRHKIGEEAWKLVILGDGELKSDLEALVSELGLGEDVLMPGFMQYPDLPVYYGLAGVYVHASTTEQWGLVVNEAMAAGLPVLVSERCGCAPDLVEEGRNGYTFDPYDEKRLTELMLKMSGKEVDLDEMGQASRKIIARWSPAAFARGLVQAAEKAVAVPRTRNTFFNRSILWMLAHR